MSCSSQGQILAWSARRLTGNSDRSVLARWAVGGGLAAKAATIGNPASYDYSARRDTPSVKYSASDIIVPVCSPFYSLYISSSVSQLITT